MSSMKGSPAAMVCEAGVFLLGLSLVGQCLGQCHVARASEVNAIGVVQARTWFCGCCDTHGDGVSRPELPKLRHATGFGVRYCGFGPWTAACGQHHQGYHGCVRVPITSPAARLSALELESASHQCTAETGCASFSRSAGFMFHLAHSRPEVVHALRKQSVRLKLLVRALGTYFSELLRHSSTPPKRHSAAAVAYDAASDAAWSNYSSGPA